MFDNSEIRRGQVRLLPTQEEIGAARLFAGEFFIIWFEPLLPEPHSMRRSCPCALSGGGTGCMRPLRMRRPRCRPRHRGARRGRGARGKGDAGGDDDGDGGSDPPPARHDGDAARES